MMVLHRNLRTTPTSPNYKALSMFCEVKVKLLSRVRLFATPWTVPNRLLHPRDSPGKSTGVGCHFLLQEIFSTQGLNPGLTYCRQTLYRLNHQGDFYLWIWRCHRIPDGNFRTVLGQKYFLMWKRYISDLFCKNSFHDVLDYMFQS